MSYHDYPFLQEIFNRWHTVWFWWWNEVIGVISPVHCGPGTTAVGGKRAITGKLPFEILQHLPDAAWQEYTYPAMICLDKGILQFNRDSLAKPVWICAGESMENEQNIRISSSLSDKASDWYSLITKSGLRCDRRNWRMHRRHKLGNLYRTSEELLHVGLLERSHLEVSLGMFRSFRSQGELGKSFPKPVWVAGLQGMIWIGLDDFTRRSRIMNGIPSTSKANSRELVDRHVPCLAVGIISTGKHSIIADACPKRRKAGQAYGYYLWWSWPVW